MTSSGQPAHTSPYSSGVGLTSIQEVKPKKKKAVKGKPAVAKPGDPMTAHNPLFEAAILEGNQQVSLVCMFGIMGSIFA